MNDEILSELEEAGESAEGADLDAIVALADRQIQLEADVDRLTESLKSKKLELNKIQLDELPSALEAARLKEFTLANDKTVTLSRSMTINVPKSRKSAIVSKLREMGQGALVRNTITIPVDKGHDDTATEIMSYAEDKGVEALRVEDIHSASLKALLRRRMDKGENDDLSFFGAYVVKKTTIK